MQLHPFIWGRFIDLFAKENPLASNKSRSIAEICTIVAKDKNIALVTILHIQHKYVCRRKFARHSVNSLQQNKKKTNQFNDSLMVGLRFLYDVKKVHINAIMVVNYIPFHSMNVMVLILKQ